MELERRLRGSPALILGDETKLDHLLDRGHSWSFHLGLFFTLRNRPSSASVAPFAALGEVTAQETAKLLDNKGSIVVVTRDTSQYPAPELEVQLKAFQRTVKQRRPHPGCD